MNPFAVSEFPRIPPEFRKLYCESNYPQLLKQHQDKSHEEHVHMHLQSQKALGKA